MKRRGRLTAMLALVMILTLFGSNLAMAHPDHGERGVEQFRGEGVAGEKDQHGGGTDHLPLVHENVNVIGRAQVSQQGAPARADVWPTSRPTATTPT